MRGSLFEKYRGAKPPGYRRALVVQGQGVRRRHPASTQETLPCISQYGKKYGGTKGKIHGITHKIIQGTKRRKDDEHKESHTE